MKQGNLVDPISPFARPAPTITKQQEMLLNKLIHFDSLDLRKEEKESIKTQLYNLFFVWRRDDEPNSPESVKNTQQKFKVDSQDISRRQALKR